MWSNTKFNSAKSLEESITMIEESGQDLTRREMFFLGVSKAIQLVAESGARVLDTPAMRSLIAELEEQHRAGNVRSKEGEGGRD